MNEIGLKSTKSTFLSVEKNRIPKMFFDGLDVYLRQTFYKNSVSWNIY